MSGPIAKSERTFRLVDVDADAADGVLSVPGGVSDLAPGCRLEPLRRGHDPYLLLLAPAGRPARVNGEHLAHVVCLRDRDVVQLDGDEKTWHVTLVTHTVIGRAPAEYAGRQCVLCHRPIGEAVVYICCGCDAVLHHDCLLGTECPTCHAPVQTSGPSWSPEEL